MTCTLLMLTSEMIVNLYTGVVFSGPEYYYFTISAILSLFVMNNLTIYVN